MAAPTLTRHVLGDAKVVAGEMAVEDPVASLFGRYFTVRTDRRKIDHGWSVGELEHLQKDAVIEYLQMPEGVRNVEVQLGALRGDLSKLTEAMNRLVVWRAAVSRGLLWAREETDMSPERSWNAQE